MKIIYKLATLLLLLALASLPTSAVHASGILLDGRVIFGDNFTLESGEVMEGDLVVFGGNVVIEEDAVIEGDLVVIGGNVTMDGVVEGSAVAIGGAVTLGQASVIEGDLVTVGGALTRAEGSQVEGDVVTDIPAPDIEIPDVHIPESPAVPTPPTPAQPKIDFNFSPLDNLIRLFSTTLAVALLAMLASLFLQPQTERVAQAVVGQPVIAGSVGLLVAVLSPVVLLILAITIILIPVVILAAAALALAWLFGVIAIGTEVGERFTRAINQTWAPPLTAGFGTFLMMLIVGGIGMVPCIGWLVPSMLAMLGIGGVTLTVFGSRPYPRIVTIAPAPPAAGEPAG
jgi:cytoskeletal protein CcmA (bactofilin family)